jgi:hypothetical protein
LAGAETQQWSDVLSKVSVGETTGQQMQDKDGGEQGSYSGVVQSQRRGALVVDALRTVDVLELSFAERRVVAQLLDVEQTSVGPKTDLAQTREILELATDVEVVGIVDDCFGTEGSCELVVLLDATL